jgi:hypothetical protein
MTQAEFIDRFTELVEDEAALLVLKNNDYVGSKAADPLGNFNRVAKILALYPGLDLAKPEVVGVVYMLKQLDSVLNGFATGTVMAVETYEKRLQDLAIYPKLITLIIDEARSQKASRAPERNSPANPGSGQPLTRP